MEAPVDAEQAKLEAGRRVLAGAEEPEWEDAERSAQSDEPQVELEERVWKAWEFREAEEWTREEEARRASVMAEAVWRMVARQQAVRRQSVFARVRGRGFRAFSGR